MVTQLEKPEGKGEEKTPVVDDKKPDAEKPKEFKPIETQDDFNARIQDRIDRAKRKAVEEAESDIESRIRAEIDAETSRKDDEEKGEWRKLYDAEAAKVAELEKKIASQEVESMKISILEGKGLTASVAHRITGTTKEEIESDVEKFLEERGAVAKPPSETGVTTPGFSNKKPKPPKTPDGKDLKDPKTWGLDRLSR